jgi:mono/diheme cytochrome c family protein
MDKSSLKLFGVALGGIVVLFLIYTLSAAWLGQPVSKVANTFARYLALFLTASFLVWAAGKFVSMYNSGWFLQIVLVGIASIFFAWIGLVSSYGSQRRQFTDGKAAARTVNQLEAGVGGEDQSPNVAAAETKTETKSEAKPMSDMEKVIAKYNLPKDLTAFDENAYTSSAKIYEVVPAKFMTAKNASGEPVKIEDADMFLVVNHFVGELKKRDEAKAAAAKAAEPKAAAPSVAETPKVADPKETTAAVKEAVPVVAAAGGDGLAHEDLYKKKCAACHSLSANAGKLKGKWMKSPDKTVELVKWMQKLSKNDRSKTITDDDAAKISAFITAGGKLY